MLTSCHLDGKFVNLIEKTINQSLKKTKNSSNYLQDADFKKMSFSEFNQFLIEYSKNSDYPDINN